MYAHLSAPVPWVREAAPEVPEDLDALARKAMAKDPDDRFATAMEMAEALMDTLPARPGRSSAQAPPAALAEEAEAAGSETAPTGAGVPLGYSEEVSLAAETAEELPPAERRAEPAGTDTSEASSTPATPPPPPSPALRSPARRRGLLLALIGAALAAAAVVLVLSLSGSDPPEEGSPSAADGSPSADGSPQQAGGGGDEPPPEQPPLAFRLADAVSLDSGPDGLAAASGTVWVADKRNARVVPVDEATANPEEPIAVGPNPDSVAIGFGSVWVTGTDGDTVTRIDPASPTETDTIEVGRGPEGIAVSSEAVWVANGQAAA